MGKVVKKVAKAAVVGAVVGLTGGIALPALGLAAPFGGVAAGLGLIGGTAFTSAIGGAAIFGGLSIVNSVSRAFAKKPNMDVSSASDAVQRLRMSVDPDAVSKLVFGTTALGTDIVYVEQIDDDKVLYIIELAGHEIDSITGMWINDESVSFSGNAATGEYADILWRYVNLGTEDQTYLTGFGADWPSTARGRGRAHMALVWDLKAGKDKLAGGIPTRLTIQGKGALCYDPRLDTTVGGSGSHRADDQSTWEYSPNWALIVLTYLLGWRTNDQLVIGKGENPDNIDYDSWIAMANVCEEIVDGNFRYLIGGMFSATNDHDNILTQFESAINGHVAKVGGKWYAWVPHDDLTPAGTITEADLVRQVGVTFSPSGEVRDLYNTGRGRYISPALLYQTDFYPEVTEATAVTEDGGQRILPADYSIIQNVSIAERVTRTKVRRSRFTATWSFAMSMKGLLYRPFSIVTLNIKETNYEDVTVRVLNMSSDWKTGIVAMTVIEEDASIYDDTIPLGTPVTQLDPGTYDPAASVSVSGLAAADTPVTGDSGTAKNYLLVSWDDPGGFVDRTDIQYRVKSGPGATQNAAPIQLDLTQSLVGPVEQTTVYEVRARHITRFGVVGAWSSWIEETSGGDETTGTASSVPWTGVTNPDGTKPENNATKNTNTDNLIRNPGFEDGTLFPHAVADAQGASWLLVEDDTSAETGDYYLLFNPSGQTGNSLFAFNTSPRIDANTPGDQFHFRIRVRPSGSGPWNDIRIRFAWRNAAGGSVSNSDVIIPASGLTAFSWQTIEGSGTASAGSVTLLPILYIENDGGSGQYRFDNAFCIQKRGSDGLTDGAVTTEKLVDLAITETKIADDSISTSKLQANSVTANEILANTITASKFLTDEGVDLAALVPGDLNAHYEDTALTSSPTTFGTEGSESGKYPSNPLNVPIDGHRVKYQFSFEYRSQVNTVQGAGRYRTYYRIDGGSWILHQDALPFTSGDGVNWSTETYQYIDEFFFPGGTVFEVAITFERTSGSATGMQVQNVEVDINTEFFK